MQVKNDYVESCATVSTSAEVSLEDQAATEQNHRVISKKDVVFLEFEETTQLAVISPQLKEDLIRLGPTKLQNIHRISSAPLYKGRRLTTSLFEKVIGEDSKQIINRQWLLYSPTKQGLYCFCCLLDDHKQNAKSNFITSGFKKWRKSEKILEYERSHSHRLAFIN